MGIWLDLFSAFRRLLRKWKLVLVLWAVNLLIALVASTPFMGPVFGSMMFSPLVRGHPLFSGQVAMQLRTIMARHPGGAGAPILLSLLLALAAQPLLAGGVVSELISSARFRLSSFASECGHLWGRNLRLLFFTAPVLLLMLGVVVGSAALLSQQKHITLFTVGPEGFVGDDPFTRAAQLQLLLTGLALGFWRAYLDVCRGLVAQQQLRKTRVAAWRGLKLLLRSPLLYLAYVGYAALGFFALIGAMRLHASVGTDTTGGALGAWAVAQGVLMVRVLGMLLPTALVMSRLARRPPPAEPVKLPPETTDEALLDEALLEDELVEDELPPDELPEAELPQDELPEDELPEDPLDFDPDLTPVKPR